jgi:hypothetical protein
VADDCKYDIARSNLYQVRKQASEYLCDLDVRVTDLSVKIDGIYIRLDDLEDRVDQIELNIEDIYVQLGDIYVKLVDLDIRVTTLEQNQSGGIVFQYLWEADALSPVVVSECHNQQW